LRLTNDSYRVDETCIKVKGAWKYLYRAVDSTGQTIDFMLSANKVYEAAKRFFSFNTAWRTIRGCEAMNIIRKWQIAGTGRGAIQMQVKFVSNLFGIAA
jgi:hypothetical protein